MRSTAYLGILAGFFFSGSFVKADTYSFSDLQARFNGSESAVSNTDSVIGTYTCTGIRHELDREDKMRFRATFARTCVGIEMKVVDLDSPEDVSANPPVFMVRDSDLFADAGDESFLTLRRYDLNHLALEYRDFETTEPSLAYSFCTRN